MSPGAGGRNEYLNGRSGRATAAAAGKTRRPGPRGLVIGASASGFGPAVRKAHARSPALTVSPVPSITHRMTCESILRNEVKGSATLHRSEA